MEKTFLRKDLLQCEAAVKGNLCFSLNVQYYQQCSIIVAQFTHSASAQRVFCLLTSESEVISIVNPLLDINPKPYETKPAYKYKPNQLVISKVDGKFCSIKFTEHSTFTKWQTLLCDALAETICCDASKPVQSGRLSATRLSRCLTTCKLLTRDQQLIQQITRLKSIRRQINDTLKVLYTQDCALASPEVRKVRAGCNFIQRIYPSLRSDPDLHFLTAQLRGGRHSSEDLQHLCKLLMHVEQEDKGEFLRMVRTSTATTTTTTTNISNTVLPLTTTTTKHTTNHTNNPNTSATNNKLSLLLSPSKRITMSKRVSWDQSVLSNEKPKRKPRNRRNRGTPITSTTNATHTTNTTNTTSTTHRNSDSIDVSQLVSQNAGSTPCKKPLLHNSIHLTTDTTVCITPEKVTPLHEPVVATPVTKGLLIARVLSPHKRNNNTKPKVRLGGTIVAVLAVVVCVVVCTVYCAVMSGGYSALTFSSATGTTTVSISVSTATIPTGDVTVLHSKSNTTVVPLHATATGSTRETCSMNNTPTNTTNATNLTPSTTHIANNAPTTSTTTGSAVSIKVTYSNNKSQQLRVVNNVFSRVRAMLLSPIKLIHSLCANVWLVVGKLGSKRLKVK